MKKYIAFIIFFTLFLYLAHGCINTIQDNKEETRDYIPFSFRNSITVDVYFNDSVKARMILDNGCSEITLGETFFNKNKDKLGLIAIPKLKSMSHFAFHPELNVYIAEGLLSLSVMDTTIVCNNQSMYYVKSKPVKNFVEILLDDKYLTIDSIDGILPLRHLTQLGNVEINFDEKKIYFPKVIDSSYTKYKYHFINTQPIIEYTICYYISDSSLYCEKYSAFLDLGATGLSMAIFNSSKINKIKNIVTKGNDYLKFVNNAQRTVKSKQNLLGNDSTMVYDLFVHMLNLPMVEECIIGLNLLKYYNLVFDDKNEFIYMKAHANELNKPDISNVFYGIYINMFHKIIFIESNISTELMLGDTLLRIDDVELSNLSNEDFRFVKKNAKKGQVKTLTVLRGDKEIIINFENKQSK